MKITITNRDMPIHNPQTSNIRTTSDFQSSTDLLKWYVVQSKPREEQRAEHFLRRKGLTTYLPLMEVVSNRGFRSYTQMKPLFPGYLFCRFDSGKHTANVRWTRGVAKILPVSFSPVPVEDEVVATISSFEDRKGVIRKRSLKKKDRVRITRGPMKDIIGIFDHWASDQGRVSIVLNLINYQATVELHHSLLERIQ